MVLTLLLAPVVSEAAYNTVTHESGAQIYVNGRNYTLGTTTNVESYIINDANIQFAVATGSVISLRSSDKSNFSFDTSCTTQSVACGASESVLTINCSNTITSHTITVTPSGTCSSGASSGTGSGSNGSSSGTGTSAPSSSPAPSAPSAAPSTPPAATAPVVAPVVVPPAASVAPVAAVVAPTVLPMMSAVKNPTSKLVIGEPAKTSFQPTEKLKVDFQYKNESGKAMTVKVIRQVINSAGKVVKTYTLSKTLKSNAVLKNSVSESLAKLPPGEYTMSVKVLDTKNKNKVLEENSVAVAVEKLKKKVFVLGSVASVDSNVGFDAKVLGKIKATATLPVKVSAKYSYTNTGAKKEVVRMIRELVDGNGKVVRSKTGKWTMSVNEKYSLTFSETLPSSLPAGEYSFRIRAYDWTSKALLAENSLGFKVELR